MRLTILGSGSPEANARRASSGYLVETGADRLLFDCGGGVVDNLIRSGRLPRDITHLFFTHFHSDHMMDYARLVHAAWDEGAPPLKVIGPPPLAEITDGFFGPDGVLRHDLRARTQLPQSQQVWVARGGKLPRPWPAPEVIQINAGETYCGEGWRATAAHATHAEPFLECLGFAVQAEDKKFVYSGDTGINPHMTELCRDADVLLHWCYRGVDDPVHPILHDICPDPGQIAEMAQRAGIKRLLLSHFRVHMDTEDGHAQAINAMKTRFDGPCEIVEDLQVFDI
ncbi:MAG: MBL fold metallo-hydrolase [Pseudomonadota bacterium]